MNARWGLTASSDNDASPSLPRPLSDGAFVPSQNGPFPVPYAAHFMTADGRRELLAHDPAIHCKQAVPLAPRPLPPRRPSQVDHTQLAAHTPK